MITVKLSSAIKPPRCASMLNVDTFTFTDPFAAASDAPLPYMRSRRNAISAQPSSDDTIVCHGPGFGVVFGNVKGGSGNLAYEQTGFAQKIQSEEAQKKHTPKRRSNPTPTAPARTGSPSLAFYLSPTYGLPNSPFDFSGTSQEETLSPSSVFESSDEEDLQHSNEDDEEDDSVETIGDEDPSSSIIIRSPASRTLSSFLGSDEANASCKAHVTLQRRRNALRNAKVIEANRQFYDAINQAHARDRLHNTFDLTLHAVLSRQRESSQRVDMHHVAMQAAHVASSRRGGGSAARAVRRQLMSV